MREQIKLIVDIKNLSDGMESNKRMASLQRSGYKLVDVNVEENIQSYYWEKEKESA